MIPDKKPLSDLTIVEIATATTPQALACAAGMCGRMAADLGARVLRIENAGMADTAADAFLHTGKKRLRVPPEQMAALIADCVHADAFVLDRPTYETMDATLRKAVCVIIGMSIDGSQRGSEFTIEARSGLLDLVGDPNREPLRLGGHQISYASGLAAYLGMVSALLRRKAGKPAGPVRVDLLDIAVWLNWKTLSVAARTGVSPSRAGSNGEWAMGPSADGYVAMVYRVQEWEALKTATGDSRLQESRFQTPSLRRQNREAINAVLSDIFSKMTRAEIRAMALKYKLPLGPVSYPSELRFDPHMIARDYFREVEIDGAKVTMPTLPVKWNGRTIEPAAADTAQARTPDFVR